MRFAGGRPPEDDIWPVCDARPTPEKRSPLRWRVVYCARGSPCGVRRYGGPCRGSGVSAFSNAFFRKCIYEKCIFRKICKFLAGSFSAVSKRNFARKYAFDSIFQVLQDLHPFAPLESNRKTMKSASGKRPPLQSQKFRKKSV